MNYYALILAIRLEFWYRMLFYTRFETPFYIATIPARHDFAKRFHALGCVSPVMRDFAL